MILKRKKIKFNFSGFSAIDALLAVAVIGVAGMITMGLMTSFNVQVSRSSNSRLFSYFHTDVLARAKRVLLTVEDSASPPKYVNGLCNANLIRSEATVSGISLIEANVNSDEFNRVFTESVWQGVFSSDWNSVTCPASISADVYSIRCFELKSDSSLAASLNKDDVLKAFVKVTPVGIDPKLSSGYFRPLKNNFGWIDAKKVAYSFSLMLQREFADIANQGAKKTEDSYSNGMVWVAEVPFCDRGNLKLSISGSGLGDWLGNSIYNTTSFDEKTIGPLLITTHKRAITKGKWFSSKTDNADYLGVDYSKNVEMACSEVSYKCPGSGGRAYSSPMSVRVNTHYFSSNNVNPQVQSRFALRPRIIGPAGNDIITNRTTSLDFRSAGQNFREDSNGHMFQLTQGGNMSTFEFFVGGNLSRSSIDVTFNDAGAMCQNICANSAQKYKLNYLATLWGFNKDGSDYSEVIPSGSKTDPDITIGCNICYSKACTKMGLDVFGDMGSQPPEPLDSGVPFCAASDSSRANQVYKPSGLGAIERNKCLSYKYSPGSGGVLAWKDCSLALPVICYLNGAFAPARAMAKQGEFEFPNVSFDQAQQLCYQQSQEKGSTSNLKELFSTFVTNAASLASSNSAIDKMTSNSGSYDYYNTANQGLFIAPQSSTQWGQLEEGQKNPKRVFGDPRFPDISGKEYWIAIRSSDNSNPTVIPEVPVAQAGGSNAHNFALYWGRDGRPVFREFASGISDASGSGVGVLVNHIKYRGLMFSGSGSTSRRALCRNQGADGDFFVSSTVTSSDQAWAACRNNGGVFAAPTTPLGWAKAFDLLVYGFDVSGDQEFFPFPDPAGNMKSVWVALSGSNGASTVSFTAPSSHQIIKNLDDDSEVIQDAKPPCDKYAEEMDYYINVALPAYNAAMDSWSRACDGFVPTKESPSCNPGPAPVAPKEPVHPPWVCAQRYVERYSNGKQYAQRYDVKNKKELINANKVICQMADTGKWVVESYSKTNMCSGKIVIRDSDLKSSYINSTKWLMIQSTLGSDDIIYVGN